MKRKISILSEGYILFVILLFASSVLSGSISSILYGMSFALPLAILLSVVRRSEDAIDKYLKFDKEDAKITLLAVFPAVFAVLIVSLLTGIVVEALSGVSRDVYLGDSLILAIVSHAFVPALFEETLFRYIPLRLLSGHSRRYAILLSAIFFAMVHQSVFSIPYAFVGGALFMLIDIIADSVFPSVIIHFVNNLFSVLLIFYGGTSAFSIAFYSVLIIGTIISAFIMLKKRVQVKERLSYAFTGGERLTLTPIFFAFIALSLFITMYNLF